MLRTIGTHLQLFPNDKNQQAFPYKYLNDSPAKLIIICYSLREIIISVKLHH